MPRVGFRERRCSRGTHCHRVGAAIAKRTAGVRRRRRRDGFDAHERLDVGRRAQRQGRAPLSRRRGRHRRDRRQQLSGMGMNGPGEQRIARRAFHEPARIHHQNSMTQMPDDGKIVADEQHCGTGVALQIEQQIDDLSLDGNVQGTDGSSHIKSFGLKIMARAMPIR